MVMSKGNKGITLLELMVAVAILGVLLSLGYVNFQTWVKRARVKSAAYELASIIRLARAKALEKGVQGTVSFNNNTITAFGDKDKHENGTHDEGEEIWFGKTYNPSIIIQKKGGGNPEPIKYRTSGLLHSGNQTIEIKSSDGNYTYRVRISITGRVWVEKP